MNPYLSVIVPAYKQEKTIARDLRRIQKVLSQLRRSSELICVVDGLDDKTLENASKVKDIKAVGYQTNKGKGHAIRYGMARSRGKIIAFIDAGMDIDPNGLSMILEHFEWYKADIIVGSKRHPASKVSYPWQRKILSWGYQMGVRILFGLNIKDTQVGLKCYRAEVIKQILPKLTVNHYAFDIEMLTLANRMGFSRIYEAPIEIKLEFWKNSTLTNYRLLQFMWEMFRDSLIIFYHLNFTDFYYLRD